MTLVAAGFQTNAMAEEMFLSPETVKSHVSNAMRKLGVHTRPRTPWRSHSSPGRSPGRSSAHPLLRRHHTKSFASSPFGRSRFLARTGDVAPG